jgi:hypothetical protein
VSEDTGGKIEYVLLNGFTSTAYLDAMPEGRDVLVGTDKYTDEPVTVRRTGEQWVELPTHSPERKGVEW